MVKAGSAEEAALYYFEDWKINDITGVGNVQYVHMTRTAYGLHMEQTLQATHLGSGNWQVLVSHVPETRKIIS